MLTYPLETILAEKVETILSRGVASTRPRDFYDVYALSKLRWNEINFTTLSIALNNTMDKRDSRFRLDNYFVIMEQIMTSQVQHQFWKKYQREYNYAKDVSFDEVIVSILRVMKNISKYEI